MIRKLVQHGSSTLITSLPAKWIKSNNLKRGDEIDIEDADEGLLITALRKEKAKKEIFVDLFSNTETYIRMVILNAYRSGFDLLKVRFKTKQQLNTIQDIVDNYMLGFEITKNEENQCLIENLTTPTEDKVEMLMRRIFLIIKESIELLYQDLKNNTTAKYPEFIKMTYKLGQYDNFCKRNFSKKVFEKQEAHFIWVLSNYMLQAQHSLKHLYYYINTNKYSGKDQDIIKYLSRIKIFFSLLYEGYFEKSNEKISQLNEMYITMQYKEGYSLVEKKTKAEAIICYHLNEFVRNIYSAASPALGSIFLKTQFSG